MGFMDIGFSAEPHTLQHIIIIFSSSQEMHTNYVTLKGQCRYFDQGVKR